MKTLLIFFVLTIYRIHLTALTADHVAPASRQALAFFAAKDYGQASAIYEYLLKQELPPWQQAILLYNLGTIKLIQGQWEQADHLFQSISIDTISSLLLLRYLKTNKGLVYLRQTELLPASSRSVEDLEEKIYFLQRSLHEFAEAEKIDCYLQKLEDSIESCVKPTDLHLFSQQAALAIDQIRQQQRNQLLLGEEGLIVLTEGLQRLLTSFKMSNRTNWLMHLGETLLPLWINLKGKALNALQKQLAEEAEALYMRMLQSLQEKEFNQAFQSLQLALQKLTQLQRKNLNIRQQQIQQALVNYQILFTQNSLSLFSLQALIREVKQLGYLFSEQALFQSIIQDLETSFNQLQTDHETITRFFLFHSFYQFQDLVQSEKKTKDPKVTLEKALQQAKRALHLNRLAQLEKINEPIQKQIEDILKKAQLQVLQLVQPFLDNVLTLETEHFRQIGVITSQRCQEKPWDQALPLFEEGYHESSRAWNALSQIPTQPLLAQSQQEQTVKNWQQVLQLMEQQQKISASAAEEDKQTKEEPPETPAHINDIFNLIQEMDTQDTPIKQEVSKELHTW